MSILKMEDLDLAGRRVLIREDLNVPVKGGVVVSDARIRAALPTLQAALGAGAAVLLMSHLGRPDEGQSPLTQPEFSMAPVAARLSELLGRAVPLADSWLDGVEVTPGQLVLVENVRFQQGEKANDEALARRMAALCDIYVMDAFATAHRAQASTCGVARYAQCACAGPLLLAELDALERALANPARPLIAVVGGSKVSTKLEVLDRLAEIADGIIVGGGIANTFIAAAGFEVGRSLHEADLLDAARRIAGKVEIPLPVDVMTAQRLDESSLAVLRLVDEVPVDEMILDIGPRSAASFADLLKSAGTVLWNGPCGVFEIDQFGEGTRVLAEAIAASDCFSIAGGGDTLAAIDKYGVRDGISYISTGGGAFLEFVEGRKLPAVAILEQRASGP
ncbi:MAG: phosphoglycerate kinase [Gammaproteobacteria bacterium]|nr:MAG: phosphoglycerate kinase [Gammaproteobacteria bacterium]